MESYPEAEEFSERELVHIGEEIADVFIYTTRLSDICNVDLAFAVQCKVNGTRYSLRSGTEEWHAQSLDKLTSTSFVKNTHFRSQRHVCFALLKEVGKLCAIFERRPESECRVGLACWNTGEVQVLADHLATICLLLSCLAKFTKTSLCHCITDKFLKNAKKYPADRTRGSSAKYTAYEHWLAWYCSWPMLRNYAMIGATAGVSAYLAYTFGYRKGSLTAATATAMIVKK